MGSTRMELVSTVDLRRLGEVEAMLGRAMARQSARSWGPQEDLLRGRLARVFDREVVFMVTVVGVGVEGAGIAHDRLLRLCLI